MATSYLHDIAYSQHSHMLTQTGQGLVLLYFWLHTSRFAPPSALSSQICMCACLTDCTYTCVDDPPPTPMSHRVCWSTTRVRNTATGHSQRDYINNTMLPQPRPLLWFHGREGARESVITKTEDRLGTCMCERSQSRRCKHRHMMIVYVFLVRKKKPCCLCPNWPLCFCISPPR